MHKEVYKKNQCDIFQEIGFKPLPFVALVILSHTHVCIHSYQTVYKNKTISNKIFWNFS